MTTATLPATLDHDTLVKMAGTNIPPVRVQFKEAIYDGTLQHAQNPEEAVEGMRDAIMSEYESMTRTEDYVGYTVAEVAVALTEALERLPYGKSIMVHTMGKGKTPVTKQVDVGYKLGKMMTHIVPDGDNYTAMSLPGFTPLGKNQPAWVTVHETGDGCRLIAGIRRRDQGSVSGLFEFIRRWADQNSIYVGQCIDTRYRFHDLSKFRMDHVAMTDVIRTALTKYVVGPLTKMDRILTEGLSSKTGILLEGDPGGGKTMTMTWCEAAAVGAGATVIRIPAGSGLDGFRRAEVIGRRLMKSGYLVMWTMEDVETLSAADRSQVLDILDGGATKNDHRIIIATTNAQEKLEEAFKRPGRWNVILHCGLPDVSAYKQMCEIMLAGRLDPNIDWERAFASCDGYTYAFIGNSVDSIVRGAIARDVDPVLVTTNDLVQAGEEQRAYFELLQQEQVVPMPELDTLFEQKMFKSVSEYLSNHAVTAHDATDYDAIESVVDDRIESRIHGSVIENNDGEQKFTIRTN